MNEDRIKEVEEYIYLPKDTILKNRYLVIKELGKRSNFSIVYLVLDKKNNLKKVIKEFFPLNLCLRDLDKKTVVCKRNNLKFTYEKSKNDFLNEAKIMQKLKNKNIAKCYDFFEENNTGYIVMKYYEGKTLKEKIDNEKAGELEEMLKKIFFPILDAVDYVHRNNTDLDRFWFGNIKGR